MEGTVRDYSSSVRVLFWLARVFSAIIYFFIYKIFKYRYDVIVNNLRRSFPQRNEEQIKEYARSYYKHLGDLVVEPLLFILVDDSTRINIGKYTNIELIDQYFDEAKNVVVLASHCGNWEFLINMPLQLRAKVYTAYTPLSNKTADRKVLQLRSLYGVYLIAKQRFYKGALAVLRNTEDPAIVVVISDQRPAPGSAKHLIHFMEQPTYAQVGAERLAVASNSVVVFLECIKVARFHYEYTFHLVTENAASSAPMEITNKYYSCLEQNILKSPPQWLWSHNRWKPLSQPQKTAAVVD